MTDVLSDAAQDVPQSVDTAAVDSSHPNHAEIGQRLRSQLSRFDLFHHLAAIRAEISGRIVFTTSFGVEDQAIAHAIFTQELAVDVVTLDTGRLFPETHQVWAATEKRYRVRVRAVVPEAASLEALIADQGADGFRASLAARHACCHVRKVVPLSRAIEDASAWVTGLRCGQSETRGELSSASFDAARRLVKVNPLFDWTREAVVEFVRTHGVPTSPLHERGFLSIGCAPCTRAVRPGELERAGRWWWERNEKKECGLHVPLNGSAVRSTSVTG